MLFCTLSPFVTFPSRTSSSAAHAKLVFLPLYSFPSARLALRARSFHRPALLNILRLFSPGTLEVRLRALCNGFLTNLSEYQSSLSVFGIIQCLPQPHATSFHKALYVLCNFCSATSIRPSSVRHILGWFWASKMSRWALCVTLDSSAVLPSSERDLLLRLRPPQKR